MNNLNQAINREEIDEIDDQELEEEIEEEEEQKKCIACETVPDSIICLACQHDICIPCAARVILTSQDLNVNRKFKFEGYRHYPNNMPYLQRSDSFVRRSARRDSGFLAVSRIGVRC